MPEKSVLFFLKDRFYPLTDFEIADTSILKEK
jgi:hypothetical protein